MWIINKDKKEAYRLASVSEDCTALVAIDIGGLRHFIDAYDSDAKTLYSKIVQHIKSNAEAIEVFQGEVCQVCFGKDKDEIV